jgi:hypothetical protein
MMAWAHKPAIQPWRQRREIRGIDKWTVNSSVPSASHNIEMPVQIEPAAHKILSEHFACRSNSFGIGSFDVWKFCASQNWDCCPVHLRRDRDQYGEDDQPTCHRHDDKVNSLPCHARSRPSQ